MFQVRWKRAALDFVTELGLDSADRSGITAAVDEVDRLLTSDPENAGESRSETVRILFVAPLGVFFEVDEPKKTVHVLRAWTF
jgi:hypothetical protein